MKQLSPISLQVH